jgi:hypothetical protein
MPELHSGVHQVRFGTSTARIVLLATIVLLLLPKVPVVPGTRTTAPLRSQLDLMGAFLAVAGLTLLVAPLTEVERLGRPLTAALTALGAVFLVAFWMLERHRQAKGQPAPMMPPSLWKIRSLTVANVVTFVVYRALSSVIFLLTLGCVLMALGIFMLAYLPRDPSYWTEVIPGVMVFSAGMTLIVAPITTTALGDIPAASSGVGSGVNNAVARIGGLVTVAVIPVLAGLAGISAEAGLAVMPGYNRATITTAGVCTVGAVVSWWGFHQSQGRRRPRNRRRDRGPDVDHESGARVGVTSARNGVDVARLGASQGVSAAPTRR